MGGRWHSKRLVEGCLVLDINFLARRRFLTPDPQRIRWLVASDTLAWAEVYLGASTTHPVLFVILHRHDDANGDGDEFTVGLDLTAQHLGGQRRWLRCCLCSRRVARLYMPAGECNWGCRSCHALTYYSVKTAHSAERVRARTARICGQGGLNGGYEGRYNKRSRQG